MQNLSTNIAPNARRILTEGDLREKTIQLIKDLDTEGFSEINDYLFGMNRVARLKRFMELKQGDRADLNLVREAYVAPAEMLQVAENSYVELFPDKTTLYYASPESVERATKRDYENHPGVAVPDTLAGWVLYNLSDIAVSLDKRQRGEHLSKVDLNQINLFDAGGYTAHYENDVRTITLSPEVGSSLYPDNVWTEKF